MKQSTMIAVGGVTVAVVAAAVIVGVSVGNNNDSSSDATDDFNQFCATYGISYDSQSEYNFRQNQYEMMTTEITKINQDSSNTFTAAHNPYSVMTSEEYKQMLGFKPDTTQQAQAPVQ
mmetsp:Transcript_65498/g.90539  ORF Transcript_65498/g.90539 Transcript_65498/m.90539 type:complete len:118 (+) Transcript_65498:49-402(+)|eukprot:CAMPEP_0176367028 /NCGR_PEP_ID=MMETSP0126-20121128/21591_1 /TAXON_ID=141414 ORGANISM="Strombidinopsis acuminatum, Strain SPMC142" /NCGR_SAMPLE_ID=MMETSP0126 /ASSEMBLY_ACC=CAM_ASM_000229 /LENGTH=117 /DNA_ID=CAMNT_0017724681 /DNA_START=45 /DNA_END=398 /DNA_ORIENTATION=+